MADLFRLKMQHSEGGLGRKMFRDSNLIMNKTFDRDLGYQKTAIYDRQMNKISDIEFKFQRVKDYTINKDQVEYMVQFRPEFHPEKDCNAVEEKGFLGFYLDVVDDAGEIHKWLIIGKEERLSFPRYNVLECNWIFKWIKDGVEYRTLGVLRSRNNYNSGVWREYFTTTVQNQIQFIVPANDCTYTINYDDRFMLSHNKIYPKVYKTTKVEDTFPSGVVKVTLAQDHFNPTTDSTEHQICDLLQSSSSSPNKKKEGHNGASSKGWVECDSINNTLKVGGSLKKYSLKLPEGQSLSMEPVRFAYQWNKEVITKEALADLLEIVEFASGTVSVKAISRKGIGGVLAVIFSYVPISGVLTSVSIDIEVS